MDLGETVGKILIFCNVPQQFGTWIGWIVKMFDYINRVNLTLPLSVYEGTWTHSPPLVAMHFLDRSCVSVGIF